MKKFTFLIALFLLVGLQAVFAQKVVVIGMNHSGTDGFSFVATETIPVGEIIYFTDNEYSDAINAFTFNGATTGEAVVKFTVTSALSSGDVVFVNEIGLNTFTVTGSGGSGTAVNSMFTNNGGFSLATNGDNIYAYSDTDEDPVNGITQIYSVLYTGSGEAPAQNGGNIPTDANPVGDFPNAIVVDGFADDGDVNVGPDRVEYKFSPATLRDGVSKAALENPSNYLSYVPNQPLSIVPFTNLNLGGTNPVLTLTASPSSVTENGGPAITFTFSLSVNATSNITVNFSVGGTATFNNDYIQSGAASFSASSGTVTIASGTNTASFTISSVGDNNLEPNETVILTLTAGTGYDAGSPGAATITIVNDDTSPVTPMVAVTGINQDDPEGFSFVALDDIPAGTIVYFTENSFDKNLLAFSGAEGVISWTAPGAGVLRGEVIVVKENPANTFTATSNSGNSGTISLISGTLSLASTGEEFYAYSDADNNPLNGVSAVYSVLFTGTTITSGGNIPAIQDPSSVYTKAVVVDGFAALAPNRTEYDPAKRGVTVDQANFQNTNNWLHAQTNQDLSPVPFSNIIIASGSANPIATLAVSPSSVAEDSGTGLVYTFSLSAPASGNITVNFSVGGTATFNADYTVTGAASFTASTGSVTILDGTSSAAVTIIPTVDSDVEVQETVALMISSGTGYDGGSPNDATGRIINDDTSLSDPLVAITGLNHTTNDGFSFVAAKDIPAGTKIYFTENSFNNTTLMFGSGESVLLWTSPGSVVPAGQVIVVTETGTDVFSLTRSGGSADIGSITVISGGFAIATEGETFYAYKDNNNDPTDGVEDIYAVLYTGVSGSPGGSIPATEDPSGIYLSALVVDGFPPPTQPNRTEYDPTKRNVLVEAVDFENTANWLHAGANQVLSTVPFDDIQIIDLIPPVAVCKDITIDLFGSTVNITGIQVDNGSNDNIGVVSYSLDISTFTCADVGTPVTVTLTVADAAGNTDNCTATVTVLDKKAPSPICINGLSFNLDASGNFTLVPGDISASPVTDNCSAVTLSLSKSDFTCADIGTNIVQLHATDENGNSDYCETAVTIKDVTAPTAVCQNINVYLDAAGTATIVAADIDGGSTDICGAVTLSASSTTYTCANIGSNNVTLTVTDQSTNSANCVAVVTVIDTVSPTAVCQNITVNLDAAGTASIVAADIDGGTTDNCGTATLSASATTFTCADLGNNNVTLTVDDGNGNTSNCVAVVTVVDSDAPNITCPGNQIETANANCEFTLPDYTGLATVSDNCGAALVTQSPAAGTVISATTTVTLTANDGNGNSSDCSFDVSLTDVTPPTAVCQNINVYLDGAGNASITAADIDGGSTDNCSAVTLSASSTSFTCANIGPNNVTLTVTDQSINSANCVAVVTVIDSIAPTAICQNITVNLNAAGAATIVAADIDAGSTDNCGTVTLSASSTTFTCAELGPNNVTLTVDDGNGNTSVCVAVVTVADPIPPTAVCQNITGYLDATGTAKFVAADIDGGSFDNCGTVALNASATTFTCADLGPNAVILTVTDQSTNSANCVAFVTVIDTVSPTAVCQNITVNLDAAGTASIVAADIDGGSTDICGTVNLKASATTFTCANLGNNNVTLTVDDGNGNTSNCVAVVTVVDADVPTIICPGNQIENAGANCEFTLPDYTGLATATDNCGVALVTQSPAAGTVISASTTVTLTANDGKGNTSDCSFDVSLIDAMPPTAVCQNITVSLDQAGVATIIGADIDGGSTDNCSNITLSASTTTFSCANLGPNNVTLTVTDQSTNFASCVAVVTVVDAIAPVAICQDITVNLDAAGNATITAADIDNGSTDNCSLGVISASQTSFSCADVGLNTVMLTVPDINGNSSTCTSTVTVADVFPPVAVCKDAYVYLNESGNGRIAVADIDGGSTDNCGILSLTASQTSFNCDDIGKVDVTLTVKDVHNNISTCIAPVYVSDLIFPIAKCKDITVSVGSGVTTITASDVDNGSTDNCGIEVMKLSKTDFTIADMGSNKVTLTAFDKTGYFGSCEAVVTVGDFTAPDIKCNPVDIILDESGKYELTSNDIFNLSAGTTDNLDIYDDLVITASPDSLSCVNVGVETIIELTATDKAGNSSSCSALVNVIDTATLVLNPVEDVNVELAPGVCETKITYPNVVSLNSCASVSQVSGLGPDGVFPVGTTTETWMATNTNGDKVEVSFNVIVSSVNSLPTLNPISNIIINEGAKTADVNLTGISQGMDCETQSLMISAINTGTTLITDIVVDYTSPDSTGMLHLAIAPDMIGIDTITVTVSDGESSVSEKFTITIAHVNQAPVVVNPIDDQAINASHVLKIPISSTDNSVFEDLDGDTLTYSLLVDGKPELPHWMTVENDTLILAPAIADTGCVIVVVVAMDPYNAMAADTFQLCVEGYPTGSNDLNASTFDVNMFPNPTTGEVSLKINSSEIMDSKVIVRSITGSEVFRKEYKASELIMIDLSEHVSGIYLITLQTGNKSVVKKLIIDRK